MALPSHLILTIFALVISVQDIKEHKIKNRILSIFAILLVISSILTHSLIRQIYSGILIFAISSAFLSWDNEESEAVSALAM